MSPTSYQTAPPRNVQLPPEGGAIEYHRDGMSATLDVCFRRRRPSYLDPTTGTWGQAPRCYFFGRALLGTG
jgi:hypothetical protein